MELIPKNKILTESRLHGAGGGAFGAAARPSANPCASAPYTHNKTKKTKRETNEKLWHKLANLPKEKDTTKVVIQESYAL